MVEEANTLLYEGDTQTLRGLEDGLVILAATWSGNILDSRLRRPVDVVGEGELKVVSIGGPQ